MATEWPEFARSDFSFVRDSVVSTAVIDTRNILDADRVLAAGLDYSAMRVRVRTAATRGPVATAARSLAASPQ